MSIRKTCNNKVYTGFTCVSNGEDNMLHSFETVVFSLYKTLPYAPLFFFTIMNLVFPTIKIQKKLQTHNLKGKRSCIIYHSSKMAFKPPK